MIAISSFIVSVRQWLIKLIDFLALLNRPFSDISVDSFTCLYKSIVRPILEYGNLVWGPYYKTDIQKLEKIQRKTTRMIKSIRNLDYEERLKVLNLPSLHYRRYRGDMIAVYNMLHDKYDIDHSDFFYFSPIQWRSQTRASQGIARASDFFAPPSAPRVIIKTWAG